MLTWQGKDGNGKTVPSMSAKGKPNGVRLIARKLSASGELVMRSKTLSSLGAWFVHRSVHRASRVARRKDIITGDMRERTGWM